MRIPVLLLVAVLAGSCSAPFGREYEYEEELYLGVDGSATVIVNSSLPALVALRGLPIDPARTARFDALAFRRLYEAMGCTVVRVGRPWYRHGRRFVQVRLASPDVTKLSACDPLSWSAYQFTRGAGVIDFKQVVTSVRPENPGPVNWTGNELVAFRMHLPSKVLFHNVRRLKDNSTGGVERGNILTWEQTLNDRHAGVPIDMHVQMDPQSILYKTLWLFGASFVAAVIFLTSLVWWTVRKGRKRASLDAARKA